MTEAEGRPEGGWKEGVIALAILLLGTTSVRCFAAKSGELIARPESAGGAFLQGVVGMGDVPFALGQAGMNLHA